MMPADEQLVPYGEDSTLSIVRNVRQTSVVSAVTLVWERADAGRRRLAGARLTHQERKTTTYTLKNNASAATEDDAKTAPLYIDHSADPRHEGYAIQTAERAIKQTTAFSRYKVPSYCAAILTGLTVPTVRTLLAVPTMLARLALLAMPTV